MENIKKVKVTVEQQGEETEVIEANYVVVSAVIDENKQSSNTNLLRMGTVSGAAQGLLVEHHIRLFVRDLLSRGIPAAFVAVELAEMIKEAIKKARSSEQPEKQEAN